MTATIHELSLLIFPASVAGTPGLLSFDEDPESKCGANRPFALLGKVPVGRKARKALDIVTQPFQEDCGRLESR